MEKKRTNLLTNTILRPSLIYFSNILKFSVCMSYTSLVKFIPVLFFNTIVNEIIFLRLYGGRLFIASVWKYN